MSLGASRDRKTTFLLVHGAYHGPWCWHRLSPVLVEKGHTVTAIDLVPNAWQSRNGHAIGLCEMSERVIGEAQANQNQVIAVGHSFGGIVISKAAEMAPELFERLVYVSALIPENGQSAASIVRSDHGSILADCVGQAPATGFTAVIKEKGAIAFYSDCIPSDIAFAAARLRPQPSGPSKESLVLTPDRFGSVPKSYILCENDRIITPALQDYMLRRAPCEKVATLPSSHSPFFSMPETLADEILKVC